ncbi:MAG: DNA alkylation repair protein [Candidatus Schekmanbacteria bacterium]|nr:DNA alkylation repair protein [Candidatus Schekmanbacteria bacterium]
MKSTIKEIHIRLQKLGSKEKAKFLQGFFKTGPGEYAEGDIFLGISVPDIRKLVNEYKTLTAEEILPLLRSPIHEERLFALLILVYSYSKGDEPVRKHIYGMYLNNTKYINNWDLVDSSAPMIVGAYLFDRNRKPLYQLAKSDSLWERRISMIATFHFIKYRQISDTLKIAKLLLRDKEDLIHKAAGWMLREVGKKDMRSEEEFLKEHCKKMPRTMLRYAIERFPQQKRKIYLDGNIII